MVMNKLNYSALLGWWHGVDPLAEEYRRIVGS